MGSLHSDKKKYIKPEAFRIVLDNIVSMVMMSNPVDPPPRPIVSGKRNDNPFQSPFSDRPFD
jgi:hypothetical protein